MKLKRRIAFVVVLILTITIPLSIKLCYVGEETLLKECIISKSETVGQGHQAHIEVKLKPNIEYDIDVYYNSGKSTAWGLFPKTTDNDGYVRWSWKVGTRTSWGTYNIKIFNSKEKYVTTFNVGYVQN